MPVSGDDGVYMEKVGCVCQPKVLKNMKEENLYCKLSLVYGPFFVVQQQRPDLFSG